MFDLTGKVALITGGNGGIGLAMAKGLAKAGAEICLTGRDPEKTHDACRQVSAKAIACTGDVKDPGFNHQMVASCKDAFGRLDVLIANAGINRRMPPLDFTPEIWHEILDTNLTSNLFAAQAAYPVMKANGGGKIITIGSMFSIFGLSMAAAYAASKGGVVQLTKSLATAWAKDGIQVNCILPGWIDTDLTRQARIDMPELDEKVRTRTPAGRWGRPEDLVGTALFLASPASDFVTGTSIPVDGGFSVQG